MGLEDRRLVRWPTVSRALWPNSGVPASFLVRGEPIDCYEALKPMRLGGELAFTGDARGRESFVSAVDLFGRPAGLTRIEQHQRVFVHASSAQNEFTSLRNRVLMAVGSASGDGVANMRYGFSYLKRSLALQVGKLRPWKMGKVVEHMSKRHPGLLYRRAAESLKTKALRTADFRLRMFIKQEKTVVDSCLDQPKTPRAIQYRGPRANLCLGRYILAFEDAFYASFQKRNPSGLTTSKGLSPLRRAELIRELWTESGSAALCLDFSRFDAHVTVDLLRDEHSCYAEAFGKDRMLTWMLERQCCASGTSRLGFKYRQTGGRASGDVNTAVGNTLIVLALMKSLLRDRRGNILCEGDDCVIFARPEVVLELNAELDQWSANCGVKVTSSVAFDLSQVDYCSGKVLQHGDGSVSHVRNWPKPLYSDGLYVGRVVNDLHASSLRKAMAISALLSYAGQPVYSVLAARMWLLSQSGPLKISASVRSVLANAVSGPFDGVGVSLQTRLRECWNMPVSEEARLSFAMSFGVSRERQLELESILAQEGSARFDGAELAEVERILRSMSKPY